MIVKACQEKADCVDGHTRDRIRSAHFRSLSIRGALLVLMASPLQSVAISQELISKEAKTVEVLFSVLHHKDHLRKNGGQNFELHDETFLRPVVEKLVSIAATRMSTRATDAQQVKLRLAAKFDVHRMIAAILASLQL